VSGLARLLSSTALSAGRRRALDAGRHLLAGSPFSIPVPGRRRALLPGSVSSRRVDEQVVACGVVIPDRDPERRASSRAIALLRNRKFVDSLLEGTGFELLVRGRVTLVVGRRRQRNRTARRSRCRCASVTFDQFVPRTRARRARRSLCSTIGPRTAPRAPFHRSRDRARYRYYEGSRSGPAVTACQHYFENCSFSRDVMRQSSRAVLRQRSNGVRSCLRG